MKKDAYSYLKADASASNRIELLTLFKLVWMFVLNECNLLSFHIWLAQSFALQRKTGQFFHWYFVVT